MRSRFQLARLLALASVLLLAACQDTFEVTAPQDGTLQVQQSRSPHGQPEVRGWAARAVPEVMALPHTVFASVDETDNVIVFGISNTSAMFGLHRAMERLGVPVTGYRVQSVQPIEFMNTGLRTAHRPVIAGLQLHWDGYVCTLGFNVTHGGGRSFITNSHCTSNQGTTGSTAYHQPTRSGSATPIAREAHDPSYSSSLPGCSAGKVCRYSDASRALYMDSVASTQGRIAKTTGVNSGSLTVSGAFTITSQDNSNTNFSGPIHKVGRTTGWTSGNVSSTCATVNVSGSSIQLLCQTLVQHNSATIVGGGDSGSGAFRITSGDNVQLVGILWGGSTDGRLFVFSPLSNIIGELGSMVATYSSGGGTNNPPTASFTYSCSGLSCSFNGSGSSDSDGSITSYAWNFGDGTSGSGVSASRTYANGGTYNVTLTVTDNGGLTGTQTRSVSVSNPPGGGNINLTATGTKVRGTKTANLSWSGATSANVDVRRDGAVVVTTANDGTHTDSIGKGGGSHTYQICEAGTSTCSNTVTLNF